MHRVRQSFDSTHISDVEEAVCSQLGKDEISGRLKAGMKIALGVGSRGIAQIDEIVRAAAKALKHQGGQILLGLRTHQLEDRLFGRNQTSLLFGQLAMS